MWTAMLKSGVHATLSGVLLAMFIPMKGNSPQAPSPLLSLEHSLHPLVSFFVLPLFAFSNAGLNLFNITGEQLLHPVPIGIALGLILGKQIGIFGLCWLGIKLGIAKMPKQMSWATLYATAALCGIGFTMSLFIGSLAFEETNVNLLFDDRLGILVGSLISGVFGYLLLQKKLLKA